jgi:hypothetical protein
MRIRPITISAAFAVGLATLPLSTAEAQSNPAQYYPPQYYPACSQFPLEWPFCVAGAVLDIAATFRHHADPAAHGGAALRLLRGALPTAALPTADLLRAGILPSAEFFRATLSPPVSRHWHSGGRSGSGIGSG